jgi:DNA-binding GntR family transcriptional regulator
MFYVMSILEGTCARICAEKLSSENLKLLDHLHRKLEQHCGTEDRENYMAVNHRYHSLVQELAGNKILTEVINGLRQKILLYRYRQIYQPNRLKESMQEHRDLQKAFRERNPAAAERCMKKHLNRQFQALKNAYGGPSNPSAPETLRKTLREKKERAQGV